MENNSVLFNFIECIKVRPEDRLLSFWIKRIMWIVTSLSFVYAYIIGAYRSVFFLGICVFFWTLDCTFTREKIYLYLDIVCMTMVTAAVCTIVLSGEMQQYAAFMSLVTGVMSIFILGLIWGSFFAVLNVLFIVATFSLDMGDIINVAYPTVFKERFPYMMVCFIVVALFIQYEIQAYWTSKKNFKTELNNLIKKGESERADVFLKTLSTMNIAMATKLPGIEQHSNATAEWASAIAIEMGVKYPENRRYYYAGLLHDIGKIGFADEFWQKKTLNEEERKLYNSHVDIGAQIVAGMGMDIITDGALYHHERMDGTGYKGLKGDEIPLSARVVSVAAKLATYEAKGKSSDEKVEELEKQSGTAFDEAVVKAAVSIIRDKDKRAEEDKIFS